MLEIFALGGEDSVIKPSQRGERLTASMVALALMQLKDIFWDRLSMFDFSVNQFCAGNNFFV